MTNRITEILQERQTIQDLRYYKRRLACVLQYRHACLTEGLHIYYDALYNDELRELKSHTLYKPSDLILPYNQFNGATSQHITKIANSISELALAIQDLKQQDKALSQELHRCYSCP